MPQNEELRFTVSHEDAGTRMDKCITLKVGEGYSRTHVKFLMDSGFVRVNGETVKPHYIAREGDAVFVGLAPLPEIDDVEPEDIPLNILYEDDWIIVVDKPAGMVVHPGAGNRTGTLVSALLYHCGELPEAGDSLRPGIVHRLDKDTSGVIVAAKNFRALRSLAKQFQGRAVRKWYVALVKGRVEMDNGIVEAPVARHAVDRKKMNVDYAGGKEACTLYHVIQRFSDFTFLRLELKTGRTHQIRIHMKHLGHPVLGDTKYGRGRDMARLALHSETLGFTHPDTGEYMEFSSPMPEDMQEAVEKGRHE
ncbi:MAG: RluA family pseudouridine synthase [Candidatus Makaraimicrobium thalassicum]|nr:MAG: RluA family pseudouridine synthase [Candidatus Omnitrophota bacterium]